MRIAHSERTTAHVPDFLRSAPTIEPTSSTETCLICASLNASWSIFVTCAPTSWFSSARPFFVSAVSPVFTSSVGSPTPSWYWMTAALSKESSTLRISPTEGLACLSTE